MNKKKIKSLFQLLEDQIFNLEYPCSNCDDWDCKKSYLKGKNYSDSLLKKRYYKLNVIDWKSCLKEKKKWLKELRDLRKIIEFKPLRLKKCRFCKKKFEDEEIKRNDIVNSFIPIVEYDENDKPKKSKYSQLDLFYVCKKCQPKLKRKYKLWIEKNSDGKQTFVIEDIKTGVATQGKSAEHAYDMIQEAVSLYEECK